MSPTIKEVAESAGVSVSTVSRVLNDYPFVADETRKSVLEAMRGSSTARTSLPEHAHRHEPGGRLRRLGHLEPLFAPIAKGVDAVLHPRLLARSRELGQNPEREAELLSALRQRRVEGLIAAVADERAPGLADRLAGFATVLFDREVPGSRADAVCSDHETGITSALESRRARPQTGRARRGQSEAAREPRPRARVPQASRGDRARRRSAARARRADP